MSGRYPSLGFDPAPGDVAAASAVADGVAETARALAEITEILSGVADGAWRGEAAVAFRDLLSGGFRPRVEAAARSFDGAARALDDWLATMRTSQARARALEVQHAEAVRRARTVLSEHAGLPAPGAAGELRAPGAVPAGDGPTRLPAEAARAVSAAEAEVERLHGQARHLLHEYEELGREAASRLQNATDVAPDEPGFWQGLLDDVAAVLGELEEGAEDIADRVTGFLEQLAPLLDLVGDIAGMLGAVCSLMAVVPGLQALGGAALVLGCVALTAHYLSAVGETGSVVEALTTETVLTDAAGVVLGAGAWHVGRKLVQAARTGSSAAGGAAATRSVPQRIGPPVEMPPGLFRLATGGSYSMGSREAVWRVASLKISQGTAALEVRQAPDNGRVLLDPLGGRDLRAPRPRAVR